MATKVTKKKSIKSKNVKSAKAKLKTVSTDDIAANAYNLWCDRGGDAMQNWLDAEKQLTQTELHI